MFKSFNLFFKGEYCSARFQPLTSCPNAVVINGTEKRYEVGWLKWGEAEMSWGGGGFVGRGGGSMNTSGGVDCKPDTKM